MKKVFDISAKFANQLNAEHVAAIIETLNAAETEFVALENANIGDEALMEWSSDQRIDFRLASQYLQLIMAKGK